MNQRIGQLLERIIPLSDHDVEEILNEQQSASHQRFGDIAVQLGKAKPEHILLAWMRQLETRTDMISLARIGVDVQAIACLPASAARTHGVLPIRTVADELLCAVGAKPDESLASELGWVAKKRVKFVLADAEELCRWIERYYPIERQSSAA